ncbi:MAG: ABC transporter ATP-binding protein [Mycoplasmatales bacterium]
MNNNTVIKVEKLHKKFFYFNKDFNVIKWLFTKKGFEKEFHVLKGLDFEVKHGESVGILGINGAGKSTLLKIISEIYYPSYGTVEVEGKVASLLELGAGFSTLLTGRENIYLKGTYMGMTSEQVDHIIDDIIEFAEIGEYIDMPFSTYSSGMRARLGFAMAINTEPDILIIDEVFAVGDRNFQEKSRAKTIEFFNQGKTILFVSHSETLVREFCNRVMYLRDGQIVYDGDVDGGFEVYNADVEKSNYIPRFIIVGDEVENDTLKLKFTFGIGMNRTIKEKIKIYDYSICAERYNEKQLSNYFHHVEMNLNSDVNNDEYIFYLNIPLNHVSEKVNFRIRLHDTKWTNYQYMYAFNQDYLDTITKKLVDLGYKIQLKKDHRSILSIEEIDEKELH